MNSIHLVDQRASARTFRALHEGPHVLILANAWDVVSARIFETEGFRALGTTSAGISSTLGFPDGEHILCDMMAEAVQRIVDNVSVPVSADIERGYAIAPEGVARTVAMFLRVGAVGINIEDSTGDPSEPLFDTALQTERIGAARDAAANAEIPLFINARTDVYLDSGVEPKMRLRETLTRAQAYLRAGADGIFVPDMGDLDRDAMAQLAREIDAPLNVIAGAHTPPIAELEALGVARVSLGPRPMRAALALVRRAAKELLEQGTYRAMTGESLSYDEVNTMLARSS